MTDYTFLFVQMLLALVVVCLGAVLVLKFVVPRLSWSKKWGQGSHFQIVSRYGLGGRQSLYLVRIANRYFVLGGGEQGLQVICELTQEEVESAEAKGRGKR